MWRRQVTGGDAGALGKVVRHMLHISMRYYNASTLDRGEKAYFLSSLGLGRDRNSIPGSTHTQEQTVTHSCGPGISSKINRVVCTEIMYRSSSYDPPP